MTTVTAIAGGGAVHKDLKKNISAMSFSELYLLIFLLTCTNVIIVLWIVRIHNVISNIRLEIANCVMEC